MRVKNICVVWKSLNFVYALLILLVLINCGLLVWKPKTPMSHSMLFLFFVNSTRTSHAVLKIKHTRSVSNLLKRQWVIYWRLLKLPTVLPIRSLMKQKRPKKRLNVVCTCSRLSFHLTIKPVHQMRFMAPALVLCIQNNQNLINSIFLRYFCQNLDQNHCLQSLMVTQKGMKVVKRKEMKVYRRIKQFQMCHQVILQRSFHIQMHQQMMKKLGMVLLLHKIVPNKKRQNWKKQSVSAVKNKNLSRPNLSMYDV
mmetsp:Transcript_5802/g.8956  ORF Transcript_5802/g.8956 Transcript_5802/m.8956 type:complete len:253 (-) Transcript_5802:1432-2190(-)